MQQQQANQQQQQQLIYQTLISKLLSYNRKMPAVATETLPPTRMAGRIIGGGNGYLNLHHHQFTIFPHVSGGIPSLTPCITYATSNGGGGGSSSYDVTDNKTNNEVPQIFAKHIYRMNDIFHREDERLKTFDHWPLEWLDKSELARTGMFYTGEADKVKCYFCEVEIGRWEEQDAPVAEHMRWSPNCPLLRRRTTNNMPVDVEALDRALPAVSYDICGANDAIEVRPFAYAEGTINMTARSLAMPGSVNTTTAGGASTSTTTPTTYFPEFPEYAIEAARIRSFAEWPRHMKQKPEQLSEAGFFYTGVGDRVKCFSCGGGLKDWAEDDEPWEQHAVWLNKCRYLNLMKGQSYIESVIAKHKAAEAAEIAAAAAAMEKPLEAVEELPKPINDANQMTENSSDITTLINCDVAPTENALKKDATAAAAVEKHSSQSSQSAERKLLSNLSIPEEKLCKICYAGEYNTAFLPCGHVVACAKCASSVTKCPLCRKPFTDVMRVYFS